MTTNNGNINQSLIPIFKGENFEFWCVKTRTLFRSQELWEVVKEGAVAAEDEAKQREVKKKDAKALFFIQQGIHEMFFSRISTAENAKEAWDALTTEYKGSSKVQTVRLQSLRRDFETLAMHNNEQVQDFLSGVKGVVNQMKDYGEVVKNETIVCKILRSLSTRFDHVVAAIEESKDLSTLSFEALMGSLQAHEDRMNRTLEKSKERAFQARGDNRPRNYTRGGRGTMARGGRGRSWATDTRRCYACNKTGHLVHDCKARANQAEFAAEEEEEEEGEEYLLYGNPCLGSRRTEHLVRRQRVLEPHDGS